MTNTLSRKDVLKGLSAIVAASLMGIAGGSFFGHVSGCYSDKGSYREQPLGVSKRLESYGRSRAQKAPLEKLANEGLPREFQNMGFTLGKYVNRGTDKEVIILAENHITADRESQVKLIKYLVEKYGVDSLGLESCTGTYPNITFPVKSDNSPSFSFKVMDTPEEKVYQINKYFSKYNVSIPRYGLEDDSLLKFVNNINLLSANRDLKKSELIKSIKEMELAREFSESDLRFSESGTLDWKTTDTRYSYNERNKAFARNIQKYMNENNSKISAINVGALHADVPRELNYPKEMDILQDHLPYSYIIIYCGPGANPREIDNPCNK